MALSAGKAVDIQRNVPNSAEMEAENGGKWNVDTKQIRVGCCSRAGVFESAKSRLAVIHRICHREDFVKFRLSSAVIRLS